MTAKPFPPYWLEGDGDAGKDSHHGTDYLLLDAVASALNFTISVLPTVDWDEVRLDYFVFLFDWFSLCCLFFVLGLGSRQGCREGGLFSLRLLMVFLYFCCCFNSFFVLF